MTVTRVRVAIVDDEPPARRRVRGLLAAEPDVEIVGEAGSGEEAVALIESARPDVVFLDVQMPGGTGFDVVEAVGAARMPGVVFVTAYDAYAVRAFDVHALDYLLKPFDRERFREALDRARSHLGRRAADAPLRALLAEVRGAGPAYPERVVVRTAGRIRFLPVHDIDYVRAESNYVRIHAGGASHVLRETLGALEARLDPRRFLRVHRSLLVQTSRIVEMEPLFQGEYVLRLRDGTKLTSGRTYRARIQQALGIG